MARQSFIWTALPNGYTSTPTGNALRLSVLLSPRLDPEAAGGGPGQLSAFFPDWQDWPTTLAAARVDVSFGGTTMAIPLSGAAGPNRVDTRLGVPQSAVWAGLFSATTPVRAFRFVDHAQARVLSYDTAAMLATIERLYRDLARTTGDELPHLPDFAQMPSWRGFIAAVDELDRSTVDQDSGLRDPRRHFDRLPRRGRESGPVDTLDRFQLFHTPPSQPIIRREARLDDPRIAARWREHARAALPAPQDIAPALDFHQIVAALGSYPLLLRRLGLVVDLLLDPAAFAPATGNLRVDVVFPAGTLQVARTPDGSPATRTRLTGAAFDAVPDTSASLPLSGGLLDLSQARFALLTCDVDGAGLKVMNFARSLRRRGRADDGVDPVSRREDDMGAPALRTGGLMLVQRGRGPALSARFDANASRNAALESQLAGGASNVTLHAQDLIRGYRVDVWDSYSGRWRSLCRRQATYTLGSPPVEVSADPEEETIIRLATTRAADPGGVRDVLYLHEAMFSWTGWSLAAPPPGRTIGRGDAVDTTTMQAEAELPPGLAFSSQFTAVKGSLPRLRFGRKYWVRARAVDLAGNSLEPRDEDIGTEEPLTRAQPFLRYEPVAAPVIALRSTAGAIERPAEGESMRRMAIRSFNDTPALNSVVTSQVVRRVAAPPQVSVRDAELHGALDRDGKVDSSLFTMLAHQKDRHPQDPAAAIREVSLPMQGPLDTMPTPTTFAVYETGRALTYLPDPLATRVAARLFGHPDLAATPILSIPLYDNASWPDAQPFTIELFEDPTATPSFDTGARALRIPLPKGARAVLRLSMQLAPEALDLMGVLAWLDPAEQAAVRARAGNGQHWMLTPWTTVELVHAVQRPLVAPTFTLLQVAERALGATSATPLMLVACSPESTGRLDCFAEWHEPDDDAAAPENAERPSDRTRHDLAFRATVTTPDDFADATRGARNGGYPDHTTPAPGVVGINTAGVPGLPVKAHEFHDTRYRRIEYWSVATSRFREFLPSELLTRLDADGARVPTDEHLTVEGPRTVTWIPNSAPPPAPRVLYIVPTFGWSREVDEAGVLTSWRRGGGLRVYMDRGWNASGYGEMLAVVLPAAGFSGDPDAVPAAAPYKKYVTQWGNDPIWDSASAPGLAPTRADFPRARLAPDPTGAWLPPNAPDTEKDQRPGAFPVDALEPPVGRGAGPVDVVPHDVFYDEERRLWYCDIEVRTGGAYYPFIRMALARYQPISSRGAHLSNVVLADFIALPADRWLTVTPSTETRALRVAVFGVPFESSAHREASRAPALSAIDPLSGTVVNRQPASVARGSIVEVWVERLDPRWGEDFGWQKVNDALVVTKSAAGSAAPAASTPLGAAVQRHGLTLARSAGDASGSVSAGREPIRAIELLRTWRTLWEGSVTLSGSAASDVRHRLVVAEYEEYLVDDDRPYDGIPTRSGRRLVFLEHVEIS